MDGDANNFLDIFSRHSCGKITYRVTGIFCASLFPRSSQLQLDRQTEAKANRNLLLLEYMIRSFLHDGLYCHWQGNWSFVNMAVTVQNAKLISSFRAGFFSLEYAGELRIIVLSRSSRRFETSLTDCSSLIERDIYKGKKNRSNCSKAFRYIKR